MTADEVIDMAHGAGYPHVGLSWNVQERAFLMRFAALVAAAEREACAQVADATFRGKPGQSVNLAVAAAIRARGTP